MIPPIYNTADFNGSPYPHDEVIKGRARFYSAIHFSIPVPKLLQDAYLYFSNLFASLAVIMCPFYHQVWNNWDGDIYVSSSMYILMPRRPIVTLP